MLSGVCGHIFIRSATPITRLTAVNSLYFYGWRTRCRLDCLDSLDDLDDLDILDILDDLDGQAPLPS